MSNLVTARYAKALFEYSQEEKKEQDVFEDLKMFAEVIDQTPNLADFFKNPAVTSLQKQTLLKNVFESACHELTFRFLLFIEGRGRLHFLREMITDYQKIFKLSQNILTVRLECSTALDSDQLKAITEKLKSKFKKEIEAEVVLEPSLLGGIKIRAEGQVKDYTLLSQLARFHSGLLSQTIT